MRRKQNWSACETISKACSYGVLSNETSTNVDVRLASVEADRCRYSSDVQDRLG